MCCAGKRELWTHFISRGGGEHRKKIMREWRDLILLLLNMHGMVQREQLKQEPMQPRKKQPDTITFVLQ